MTYRMSAKVVSLALAACSLLAGGMAYAGYVDRPNVSISTSPSYMRGSMWGARHSSGANDFIECYVSGTKVGTPQMGCSARSKDVFKSCTSYSAGMVQAAMAMTTYSTVTVYFDASGECTQLSVYNGSKAIPG